MSYAKPLKQCQDAGVGFREMNKLILNQDDVKKALEFEHAPVDEQPPVASGWGDISGNGLRVARFDPTGGLHDTPKVARGTMTIIKDTVIALGQMPVRVGVATGVCSGFTRIASGQYFVSVAGLVNFYAEITPQADTATPTRMAQQTPVGAPFVPGIYISCWEESLLTGNLGFALAEYGFNVVVYGARPSSAQATPAAGPLRPARFPHRPPVGRFPGRGK